MNYFVDPSSHCATPPWPEQVPAWCVLWEYSPSVHLAIAPVGSVVSDVPDLAAAVVFAEVVAAAAGVAVVVLPGAVAVVGAFGVAGAAAAGVVVVAAGATAVVATPP